MRWVACEDGRCLTVDGDEKYGDPAEWLRHLVKCFLKPRELRADGMVVGCRRDTKELFAIQVRANRVTEKVLWPRPSPGKPGDNRRHARPTAQVIDLATAGARA